MSRSHERELINNLESDIKERLQSEYHSLCEQVISELLPDLEG